MNQAASRRKSDPEKPKSWPRFVLRVDHEMCTYLTSGKKTKLGLLSSSLKVWILLKVKLSAGPSSYVFLPWISLSLVMVSEVIITSLNTLDRKRFLPWCFWTATILREGKPRGERNGIRVTTDRGKPQTACFSYQEVDEPCKTSKVNLLVCALHGHSQIITSEESRRRWCIWFAKIQAKCQISRWPHDQLTLTVSFFSSVMQNI